MRASPLRVHEVDDPRPRLRVLVRVEAAAAGRDPALAGHADHLGHHQPGAADAARAEVHEVEITGRAVARRVHVHRRDDDAVAQLELAQLERGEHRRARRPAAGERRVDLRHEAGIAQLQLAVGDAAAAGQQVEREQQRRLGHVAADPLEPLEAPLGRALRALDDRPPVGLVGVQGGGHVAGVLAERPCEADRVLERELRPRPDREVRGVRGVAQQHDVPVAPGRVAHGDEVDPLRVVADQAVAVQHVGEQLLAEGDALAVALARAQVARVVEPRAAPRLLGGLHDERAHRRRCTGSRGPGRRRARSRR